MWRAEKCNHHHHCFSYFQNPSCLDKITNFLFLRDDALCLWSAITSFIKEIIILYYKSDDDVTNDNELQAWIKDAHDNGFLAGEVGDDHGCPNGLETRNQLIHVLTCLVFTCSCQHAAVNFGLLDVAGFVPNAPSVMRQPPPTKKNETTLKSIMDTLPSKSQAAQQVALGYVFTQFAEDEVSFCQDRLWIHE